MKYIFYSFENIYNNKNVKINHYTPKQGKNSIFNFKVKKYEKQSLIT